MDPRLDAQLRDALVQFLRGEGLIQQASQLPAVAPQSVQSGQAAPVPQQTLGPQPGEPRPVTRQQWMQDFGQAAGSFGASAADPLGIPSALLGTVAPGARDSWRQYAAAAGPEVQMAGGLASGFGVGNAMLRGGNAFAGVPGMIAGGAATGAAPAIDYAAGAPGSSGMNAMLGPISGGALPAGMAAAGPISNFIRANPLATAAGGATALAAGGAVAQQPNQIDPFTQTLHANNPALAAAYQRMLAARQAATAANQTSVVANQGSQKNTGAKESAQRADAAAAEAARAYETELARATDAARAANPSFRDQYGPTIGNRLVRSAALPFIAGTIAGVGGASLGRLENRLARRQVDAGNEAMNAPQPNLAAAATASGNATNMVANAGQNAPMWRDPGLTLSALFGAEAAIAPQQWNQDATQGSPEQIRADNYFNTPRWMIDAGLGGLLGATAYKGGRFMAAQGNAMLPGRNRLAPEAEATALATRVQQAQQAQQAQPPPAPPALPVQQPPAVNMPIDYEAIARGIRPQFDRPPFVPPAAQQAIPAPAAPAQAPPSSTLYTGNARTDFRNRVASAVEALPQGGQLSAASLLRGTNFRDSRDGSISTAIAQINGQLSAGVPAQQIASRIRSGGFWPLMSVGGGAAVAAHHSLMQPRGDDGRFVAPE